LNEREQYIIILTCCLPVIAINDVFFHFSSC
jgi:hypothetical protein